MTGLVTPARRASSSIDALAKPRSAKSCSPSSTSWRSRTARGTRPCRKSSIRATAFMVTLSRLPRVGRRQTRVRRFMHPGGGKKRLTPDPQCCRLGRRGLGGLARRGAVAARLRLRPLLLGLPLGRLLRPVLVELDAPLALVGLLQPELGPEGAPGARPETGDGLLRASYARILAGLARGAQRFDQLLRHRHGEALARLPLPDHEAAPWVLARPARVALAVLGDLPAADRARPELGALDLDALQLVELLDRLGRELLDVAHERRPRVAAVLDQAQAPLPAPGQLRRGQLVLAEQADHLDALLGRHERAAVALDVAHVHQPLDDRRARGGGADAGVLHRLAQLGVVDLLARRLPRAQERRVGEAPRRLRLLAHRLDLERPHPLALLQPRKQLVAAGVVV